METELPNVSMSLLSQLGIKVVSAIALFLIGRWLASLVTKALRKFMAKSNLEDTLENFLANLLYAALMAAVIIATINQLGIQTTSLLAVVGAAGLAIGLALQGSLSNFAAGVMIVAFRPYKVGNFIEAGRRRGYRRRATDIYDCAENRG